MGFFDSIVNAADNLGAKVSGNVDAMSINSQVSSKEKEMNNLYAQLGMAYYSIHKNDPDDACRNLVQLLINKEAELNKLKSDLAAKKAETAAIGQPNYAQQGMYQQPMGQPMNQGMGQPMMGQPMNQGMGQPMMGQPMNQGMGQPMMGQPMNQGMGQPMMGQPMNQGMGQPVMGQPMNQSMGQPMMGQPMNQGMGQPMNQGMNTPMQPIVVPIKQDVASEDKKEDKAETASEPEKTAESEGKTCSICGATGQSGAFCGNCGSKLE
jgi:hypothetical protein